MHHYFIKYIYKKQNLLLSRLRGASAVVTMRLWTSLYGEEEAGKRVRVQPWTSEELTLPSAGIFLEESYGNIWEEEFKI